MAPKVQAGFKADPSLLERIDAVAAQVMREHPGLNVSRTDAIVMLITEALLARGIDAPTEKRAAPAAPSKTRAKRGPKTRARHP